MSDEHEEKIQDLENRLGDAKFDISQLVDRNSKLEDMVEQLADERNFLLLVLREELDDPSVNSLVARSLRTRLGDPHDFTVGVAGMNELVVYIRNKRFFSVAVPNNWMGYSVTVRKLGPITIGGAA